MLWGAVTRLRYARSSRLGHYLPGNRLAADLVPCLWRGQLPNMAVVGSSVSEGVPHGGYRDVCWTRGLWLADRRQMAARGERVRRVGRTG